MDPTVLASLITGLLSLAGVMLSNLLSDRRREAAQKIAQAVTDARLEELTREVRLHNNFARRMPVVGETGKGEIKMINWKVRLKNVNFWLTAIPALLLVLQTLAALFGWQLELGALQEKLLAAVNALFALLAVLGVVNDPTTAGLKDSPRAMGYRKPE